MVEQRRLAGVDLVLPSATAHHPEASTAAAAQRSGLPAAAPASAARASPNVRGFSDAIVFEVDGGSTRAACFRLIDVAVARITRC